VDNQPIGLDLRNLLVSIHIAITTLEKKMTSARTILIHIGIRSRKMDQNKEYSEEYDAFFDPVKNEWLEDKCDDPECHYCPNRPEKPLQS
jgi:hypothetical protein